MLLLVGPPDPTACWVQQPASFMPGHGAASAGCRWSWSWLPLILAVRLGDRHRYITARSRELRRRSWFPWVRTSAALAAAWTRSISASPPNRRHQMTMAPGISTRTWHGGRHSFL